MITAYSYQRLQYTPEQPFIRILTLHPASNHEEPLSANLDLAPLDDCEDAFESLSYTWGDAAPVDEIATEGARVSIGKKLSQALRRLRRSGRPRKLWVDAVCINQMDLTEKTTQVPLMDSIYTTAKRTVVWLGESGSVALDSVIEARRKNGPGEALYFHPRKNLLDLPWSSRRWIIQEIALAKDVLVTYSDLEMKWEEFLGAADQKWRNYGPDDQVRNDHSLTILRMRQQTTRNDSILALLERFAFAKCSVPHDFIAGLLAIQTNEAALKIPFQVDYRLAVEKVYVNFAIEPVQKGFGLSILWIAAKRLKNNLRYQQPDERDLVPSWEPDWRWTTPDVDSVHECDVFHGYPAKVIELNRLEIECRLTHRLDEDWKVQNMPWNQYNDIPQVSPRKGDMRAEFPTPCGRDYPDRAIVLRPLDEPGIYKMIIAWELRGFSWGPPPPMTLQGHLQTIYLA